MVEEHSDISVGIDASNLRMGGGFNHLPQILESLNPETCGIRKVTIWCNLPMAASLPRRPWLQIRTVAALQRSLPHRIYWQQVSLPQELKKEGCDILFSPGGSLPSAAAIPTVVMSRNMLPFERKERARYPLLSYQRLRLELLRIIQKRSFSKADGLIFLTDYARKNVLEQIGTTSTQIKTIPHGIDPRFFRKPVSRTVSSEPFRFLYISTIDLYKHQWNVAEAVARLNRTGLRATIDFIGSAYGPAANRLRKKQLELDPEGNFIQVLGNCPFSKLHEVYQDCDAFVFASSCENLPNIVLEAMASGLPVLSSNFGPMPEVLGDAALYFSPESVTEIYNQMAQVLDNRDLCNSLAEKAFARSQQYSWKDCSLQTFNFIRKVYSSAGGHHAD